MNYNLFSLYHSCCSYIFGHFLVCIFYSLYNVLPYVKNYGKNSNTQGRYVDIF
jgi:hypothetical protein